MIPFTVGLFSVLLINALDGVAATSSLSQTASTNGKASMLAVGVSGEVLEVRKGEEDLTIATRELAWSGERLKNVS